MSDKCLVTAQTVANTDNQSFYVGAMANSPSANAIADTKKAQNIHQNPLNNLAMPLDCQTELSGPGFLMRGGRGYCYACCIKLTSREHCREHTEGKGHKKKVANMPLLQQHSLLSIQDNTIVGVTLPPNSLKKLAGESPSPPSGSVASSPVQILPILGGPPILEVQSGIRQASQGASSPLIRNLGPNREIYIMNGTKGFCYVCNLKLTSDAHKVSHIYGTKHKNKCSAYNLPCNNNLDPGSSKVLMCDICKVPFSCHDNAEQHFISKKHKKQEIALGISVNSRPNVYYDSDPEQTKFKHIISSSEVECTAENEPLLGTENVTNSSLRFPNPVAASSSEAVKNKERIPEEWSGEVDPPTSNSLNLCLQSSYDKVVGRIPPGEKEGDTAKFQDTQNMNLEMVEKISHKDVSVPENEKVEKTSQKLGTLLSPQNKKVYLNPSNQCSDPSTQTLHLSSQQLTNNFFNMDNSKVSGCRRSGVSNTASDTDSSTYFQPMESLAFQNREASRQPEYSSSYYADSSVSDNSYGSEHLRIQIQSIPPHCSSSCLYNNQNSGKSLEDAPPVEGNVKVESEATNNQHHGTECFSAAVNKIYEDQSTAQIPSTIEIEKSKLETSNNQHTRSDPITVQGQTEVMPLNFLQALPPARPNESGPGAERESYNFSGNGFLCSMCNILLPSWNHVQHHLNEEKHQEKMASLSKMPQLHLSASRLSPQQNFNTKREVQEISNSTFVYFSGSRGFCHPCKVELTSLQHKLEHIEGKPHSRSVERAKLALAGKVYPLNCDTCGKKFTGQESAQEHFTSSKHAHKKELSQGRVIAQLDGVEDFTIIQKGQDRWFLCNVCKCYLNTQEQLDIHKRSLKHLAQAKKREDVTLCELIEEAETRVATLVSPKLFPDLNVKEVERDAMLSSRETSPGLLGLSQNRERIHAAGAGVLQQNLMYGGCALFNTGIIQNLQNLPHRDAAVNTGLPQNLPSLMRGEGPIFNIGIPQNLQTMEHGEGPVKNLEHEKISVTNAGILHRRGSNKQPETVSYVPVLSENNAHTSLGQTNLNLSSVESVGFCTDRIPAKNEDNTDSTTSNKNAFGTGSGLMGATQASGSAPIYGPRYSEMSGGIDTHESGCTFSENKVNGVMRKPNMKTSSKGSKGGVRSSIPMESCRTDDNFESDEEEDDEGLVPPSNFNIINEENQSLGLSKLTIRAPQPERSFHSNHKYFCSICNKHMNTLKEWNSHCGGQIHTWNTSCVKAPERHLDIVKKTGIQKVDDRAFKVTNTMPRSYQVELLKKAMAGDSVVYLPTGTGKTMVAVQAIALMLQENPSRPTIFLVDKVLLVIQQAKYIKKELEELKFLRPSLTKEGELEEREPLVLAVSGGLMSKGGIPMWKYDIIVTTADFCMNMLDKGQIQWKDFSLAVLDEVHHCIKKHPYHKLLSDLHSKLSQSTCPKILGLTASPAGKKTMELTYDMLCCLLNKNLGGAKMAIVEEKHSLDELSRYESSAQLHWECVPMTSSEKTFTMDFLKYFLRCYSKLASMSSSFSNTSIPTLCYFNDVIAQPDNENILKDIAERLLKDSQPLSEILPYIYEAKCSKGVNKELAICFDHLRMYITELLLCFSNITIGLEMNELEKLLKPDQENQLLQVVKSLNVPCDEMYKRFLKFSEEKDKTLPSMLSKLLETLENPSFINWKDKSSKALVLVRERKQARHLKSRLKTCQLAQEEHLHTTYLVGHGKNAKDGGMKVIEQKRVLDNTDKYQILVATSIAEEGLDLQTLQLVVSLNPPTSVTGLVQMRGRARKEGSHFVILCDSQEQVEKLEMLQLYEKNMLDAARKFSREHQQ